MTDSYDVIIAGGGIVGLTLAGLLCDSGLKIAVVERASPKQVSDAIDLRVSAIGRSSLKVFESMSVIGDMIDGRAGVFREMHVWDATGAGEIHFDSADVGLDALGYIIENSVIQQALLKKIQQAESVDWLCPQTIASIVLSDDGHQVKLASGKTLQCRLLVGADGVNSKVRDAANIDYTRTLYQQQGIVCTVTTEQSHQETAWQIFLPSGPLAFLPLGQGKSSIVWTLDESAVQEVMLLDDEAFTKKLEQTFQYRLGAVTSVSERAAFPLGHGHVNQYVQQGLALIGDAAHTIHPLAGQGANLGIIDAGCLAQVIRNALEKKRQWYALHTLRNFERQRKGANWVMESAMTGFKNLFGNENPFLATLRNEGLGAVDHMPFVKEKILLNVTGLEGP